VLGQSPGLDPSNVLVMRASLPGDTAPGGNNRSRFCADLARESASVPGLVHVSAVNYLPLDGSNADRIITIEGRPAPAGDQLDFANYRTACPNYFTTLAITRLSGRDFGAEDTPTSLPVTIVNRAFVDHYWPKQDAIAKRFKVGRIDSTNGWLTVIGVVENVHHFALEETPMPEFYRPYAQASSAAMTLVAKTAGEPLAWQSSMRDVLKRVDPELPAAGARAMDDVISQSVAWRETPMRLLLGFAAIGLLLAAIGVYGVLSYYVSQRRREIGVRVALGASKAAVVRLVLKESATPLVAGLVIGVLGSLLSGRLLADLLYDVQPGDPIVLAGIVAVLAVVALVSGWVPARTAAATDPLVALRED
jgi:predicted permease